MSGGRGGGGRGGGTGQQGSVVLLSSGEGGGGAERCVSGADGPAVGPAVPIRGFHMDQPGHRSAHNQPQLNFVYETLFLFMKYGNCGCRSCFSYLLYELSFVLN